jgi:hypothetical protein
MKHRFRVGDIVRERNDPAKVPPGEKYRCGIVVHLMKDAGLVVVSFPPSQQGIAFHPGDLVMISRASGAKKILRRAVVASLLREG